MWCPVLFTHFETISTCAACCPQRPFSIHAGFTNTHYHSLRRNNQTLDPDQTVHTKDGKKRSCFRVSSRVSPPGSSRLTIEKTRGVLVTVLSPLSTGNGSEDEYTNRLDATTNGVTNFADDIANPVDDVDG